MYVKMVGGPQDGKVIAIHPSPYIYVAEPAPVAASFAVDDPIPQLSAVHTYWRIPITPCIDINTGEDFYIAIWDEKEA